MKSRYLVAALLLAASAPVFAATCEESFQKKGNPFVGTQFSASISQPGLTVRSAIGQMRVIAKQAKMDVLSEDADAGSMLIEQPQTFGTRPLPMIVSASAVDGVGTVNLLLKVNKGAIAYNDNARTEMCKLLNQVKPGAAGEQFAKKTLDTAPVEITAYKFGFQLRSQHKENPAAIEPRYADKVYRITGKIAKSGVLKSGGTYNITFDVLEGEDRFETVGITCAFAANQSAYALALRPSEKVTLTGVVDHYDQILQVLWLRDCRGN
ncbi:OB-fold protein [Xanthomonas nasturtii]|uniref:OB-fold protein n=1 Tax=Xanthomonas nasturtii TaxID=1843581 RepID=UPI00201151C3|nr:hypothetical protein [Xanthomonas nasturtii]MCL1498346.1 hypothetical protein [Xanthomonas nasturtii]MCL1501931.1 hypothetical protein [Xanthomonas nasturtii]MCL1521804.1 hypothetical protein [Xanthomonas nasturtii]